MSSDGIYDIFSANIMPKHRTFLCKAQVQNLNVLFNLLSWVWHSIFYSFISSPLCCLDKWTQIREVLTYALLFRSIPIQYSRHGWSCFKVWNCFKNFWWIKHILYNLSLTWNRLYSLPYPFLLNKEPTKNVKP